MGLIPGLEDLLEEGMSTHCSILAWRIPWTEEPGRQRVGRQLKQQHAHTHTKFKLSHV